MQGNDNEQKVYKAVEMKVGRGIVVSRVEGEGVG